jgi:uncharacterized membrane protein
MTKKSKKKFFPLPARWVFVILGLVFGWIMAIVNPPFHSNDEDRHFLYAYAISQGDWTYDVQNNKRGTEMPKNLVQIVKSFQGIPFHQGTQLQSAKIDQIRNAPLNPDDTTFYSNPNMTNNPLPYIPAAIGIMFGKFIDSNPLFILWSARVFSLFAYLALIFIAIRSTPVFKNVFAIMGLMPMALFQGASVTYDTMLIAAAFLYVAYVLYLALDDRVKKLRFTDYAALILILILLNSTKEGYFLLSFVFFIIPRKKIGNIGIYILMVLLFILLYYFKDFSWKMYYASLEIKGSGQAFQKDFRFGGSSGIWDRLSEPFHLASLIFKNIAHFKQEWTAGLIGRFGYSYTNLPNFALYFYGIILLVAGLIDGRHDIEIKAWQKSIIFALGILNVLMIIVGFLVIASPIGAHMIFGLQGRYFIPILPVLLLFLYNRHFVFEGWRKYGSVAVGIILVIFLTYTVTYISDTFYQAV